MKPESPKGGEGESKSQFPVPNPNVTTNPIRSDIIPFPMPIWPTHSDLQPFVGLMYNVQSTNVNEFPVYNFLFARMATFLGKAYLMSTTTLTITSVFVVAVLTNLIEYQSCTLSLFLIYRYVLKNWVFFGVRVSELSLPIKTDTIHFSYFVSPVPNRVPRFRVKKVDLLLIPKLRTFVVCC